MSDLSDVYVIVPDLLGLTVCALDQLVTNIEEGQTLEDAVTNAGIDTVSISNVRMIAEKTCELNVTGNADKFWDRS